MNSLRTAVYIPASFPRLFGATILSLLFLVINSNAQDSPFSTLFKEFDGVAVWASSGLSTQKNVEYGPKAGLNAVWRYGFEILLGPYPAGPSPSASVIKLTAFRDSIKRESVLKGSLSHSDSLQLRRVNEFLEQEKSKAEKADDKWSMEIGLGFDFSDSYRPRNDSMQIRIPVTSTFVSLYAEPPGTIWGIHYYLGGKGGLYNITNGTAIRNANNQFDLSTTAFSYELVPIGIYLTDREEKHFLFLELSYKHLAFESLRYKALNTGPLPLNAPDRFDLSGIFLTFGVQLAKK
jgi:hypothetical protein